MSVIVFLSTSKNAVVTFSIMNLISDGFYGKAAALTVCCSSSLFLRLVWRNC